MTETRAWDDGELEPCPFCGVGLKHVESLACSFSRPRTYHEFQHPKNDCLLSGTLYCFTDDPGPWPRWSERWNRRAPCPPPAAPCADEVEALFPVADAARSKHLRVELNDQMGALGVALEAALAELAHLRQTERERAWLEGAEATRSALAAVAEAHGARALAEAMRAFPLPPMGGV